MSENIQSFNASPFYYYSSNSFEEGDLLYQYEAEDIYDDEIAQNYNGNSWRILYFSFLESKINEKLDNTY